MSTIKERATIATEQDQEIPELIFGASVTIQVMETVELKKEER